MSKAFEGFIERVSEKSGYQYDFLVDCYNEMNDELGDVDNEFCKGCNGECYGVYPECESCELHEHCNVVDRFNSIGLPNYVKSVTREEHKMNLNNERIKIDNRLYYADYIDYPLTTDIFPDLEISTRISPSNLDPTSNLSITNVIFNPPATIVFWSDKTKTVVKCDPKEDYDPEKGIAMAICKKMIGDNKRDYYNVFLHWIKKYEKQQKEKEEIDNVLERLKLFTSGLGVKFGNSDDEGDTCR